MARPAGILGLMLVSLAAGWWLRDARKPAPPAVERFERVRPAPASAADPVRAPDSTRTPPEVAAPSESLPVQIGLTGDVADAVARYRGEDPTERESALSEIAGSGEPGALEFLVDELSRANSEQRQALLQAVIDFGSRDAIPKLRALAETSDDPEQTAALREAADYLALPTLKEIRERAAAK